MLSGTPYHVGSPGILLSLFEKDLATSIFFFLLCDQCSEILGKLVFCEKHVQNTLKGSVLLNGKVVVTTSLTRDPYQSGQM